MNATGILQIFDQKHLAQLKDGFVQELNGKIEEEKIFCAKMKKQLGASVKTEIPSDRINEVLDGLMTPAKYGEVIRLLGMCGNACQIEALRKFVLINCVMPEFSDIEMVANEMLTKACI